MYAYVSIQTRLSGPGERNRRTGIVNRSLLQTPSRSYRIQSPRFPARAISNTYRRTDIQTYRHTDTLRPQMSPIELASAHSALGNELFFRPCFACRLNAAFEEETAALRTGWRRGAEKGRRFPSHSAGARGCCTYRRGNWMDSPYNTRIHSRRAERHCTSHFYDPGVFKRGQKPIY